MKVGDAIGLERALIRALQKLNVKSAEYWDVIGEWAAAIAPNQQGDPVETAIAIATRHNLGGEDDWECELQLYLAGCPEKYVLSFTLHWLVQHLTLPEKEAER